MNAHDQNFLEGNIKKLVLKITIPAALGIASIVTLGIVDAYFVSLLGTEELEAMGIVFPALFLIISVGLGLGVGALSVVSRILGHGEQIKSVHLGYYGIIFCFIFSLLVSLMLLIFQEAIFSIAGAYRRVLDLSVQYGTILFLGATIIIMQLFIAAILRARGNIYIPALIMIASALLNLALDPMLIFGWSVFPRLEIAGAAVSTILTSGIGTLILLLYARGVGAYDSSSFEWTGFIEAIRKITYIGLMSVASNMSLPFISFLLLFLSAPLGNEVITAIGLGIRIEPLLYALPIAMTASVPPIVGQNWGAEKKDRVYLAISWSITIAIAIQIIVWIVLLVLGDEIIRLFTTDQIIEGYAVNFLHIVSLSYAGVGAMLIVSSSLNALEFPISALGINAFRAIVSIGLLGWVGVVLYGGIGLLIAITLGNIISGIIAVYAFQKVLSRKIDKTRVALNTTF